MDYLEREDEFLEKIGTLDFSWKKVHLDPHSQSRILGPLEGLASYYLFRKSSEDDLLISISGCHGTEARVGLEIQKLIIKKLQNAPPHSSSSLAFVMNLNPFGHYFGRRANGQNVDLNRNSLFGTKTKNADFDRFQRLLRAQSIGRFNIQLIGHLPLLMSKGNAWAQQVIAGGQDHSPEDLFFAGHEQQPELKNLIENLPKGNWKRVWVLDIHTGLGPFASENLITEQVVPKSLQAWLQKQDRWIDLHNQGSFYRSSGTLSETIKRVYPTAEVFHVTQEFGTFHFLKVLSHLVVENQMWQQGMYHDEHRKKFVRDIFYVEDPDWVRPVHEKGISTFFNLFDLMSSSAVR